MEKLRLEERYALLYPIDFLYIDQRKDLDRRSADRTGLDLSVKPDIENDLADPSVQASLKRVQHTVINPGLELLQEIKQTSAVNIEMRAVHNDHIEHVSVRLVKDLIIGFEILGIPL